jgi:hypothetical protein
MHNRRPGRVSASFNLIGRIRTVFSESVTTDTGAKTFVFT